MSQDRRSPAGVRLLLGAGVIGVGLLLILDNFDLLEADDIFIYWPVLVIAIGLAKLFRRTLPDLVFAAGLIGFGTWILLFNLDLTDLEPWGFFWPIVLIFGGTMLVLGAIRRGAPIVDEATGSTIRGFALLSGVNRTNSSPNFLGGDLTALLGGCEIDLRQAKIADGNATLEVFAFWGGIEVKVPREWQVSSTVMPFLGGFEDSTESGGDGDRPVLTIRGAVIMGGVEIRN